MPALVIPNVDFDLLDKQRIKLNDKFSTLCQAGACKEALEDLQDILGMLDEWSDTKCYQRQEKFDPEACWTPGEAMEAIMKQHDPVTAFWEVLLNNVEIGELGWAQELIEEWGCVDLPLK